MELPSWAKLSAIPAGCGFGVVLGAGVALLAGGVLCCGGPVGLFVADQQTSTAVAHTVLRHTWTREIAIERVERERDEDWCADVPRGAVVVTRREKLRERDRRRFGTDKIYAEWCTYDELKWRRATPAKETGAGLEGRVWPVAEDDRCATEGCERPGDKTERLVLVLRPEGGGAERECTVAEDVWISLADGAEVMVDIGGVVGVPMCTSIRALELELPRPG